jgi:hypothetical protein
VFIGGGGCSNKGIGQTAQRESSKLFLSAGDGMKKDEMGKVCSTLGKIKKYTQNLS